MCLIVQNQAFHGKIKRDMSNRRPYIQNVMLLRPIDDLLFNLIYQDKDACQELIRTILEDETLIVISVATQDSISNLKGRGVRLDALCKTSDGRLINVEVQRRDNDDHYRRIRYNASAITMRHTSKGTDFQDVAEVYIIYITEFNIIDTDKTVCHIDSVLRETGKVIDDGLHRIIVNAGVNDGTKSAKLMAHFRKSDFTDSDFPEASKQMKYFKHTEDGGKRMSTVMEKIINDCVKERIIERDRERDALIFIENVDKLSRRFNVTTAEACTFLDKTIEDYELAKEIVENAEEEELAAEFA